YLAGFSGVVHGPDKESFRIQNGLVDEAELFSNGSSIEELVSLGFYELEQITPFIDFRFADVMKFQAELAKDHAAGKKIWNGIIFTAFNVDFKNVDMLDVDLPRECGQPRDTALGTLH
ncbi:MAG TPA: hypothetical protein VGN88_06215, partial [Phycisphaerae bacterium]